MAVEDKIVGCGCLLIELGCALVIIALWVFAGLMLLLVI